jgi:hypothetical protein
MVSLSNHAPRYDFREVQRLPVIDAGGFKKAPKEKAGGQAGFEF